MPRTIEVVQGPAQIKHDAVVLSVPKGSILKLRTSLMLSIQVKLMLMLLKSHISLLIQKRLTIHGKYQTKISLQDERTPPRPKSILEHSEVDSTASYDKYLSKLSDLETPVATTRRKVFNININLTDKSRNVLDEKEPSSPLNLGASICTSDIEDLTSH